MTARSIFRLVEGDGVNLAGAIEDANHGQAIWIGAKIGAIFAIDVRPEAGLDPLTGSANVADAGDAVKIGDDGMNESFSLNGAIGGDMIIDVIKISLGRIRDN